MSGTAVKVTRLRDLPSAATRTPMRCQLAGDERAAFVTIGERLASANDRVDGAGVASSLRFCLLRC